MMSVDDTLSLLKSISSLDDEETDRFLPILKKNYYCYCDNVSLDTVADENRLMYFVAAKTNYEIMLIKNSESSVTSFTAGDVTVTESGGVSVAKDIYESARCDVSNIIGDNCFAFLDV